MIFTFKLRNMLSGYKFIRQLSKQGLRGEFFNYEEYKTIGKIKSYDELKTFVRECGFDYTEEAKNEKELVEVLKGQKEGKWTAIAILDAIFWALISLASCS